jgi:hypothetical protein
LFASLILSRSFEDYYLKISPSSDFFEDIEREPQCSKSDCTFPLAQNHLFHFAEEGNKKINLSLLAKNEFIQMENTGNQFSCCCKYEKNAP